MDPITIIGLLASITNLIHASKSITRTIYAYKEGDEETEALADDISLFSEALHGFERVLRSRQTVHQISLESIDKLIKSSGKILEDLQARISEITAIDSSAVRRLRWVQHTSSIRKLHDRLKEQRTTLQSFLSIIHAETFLSIASQTSQSTSTALPIDEQVNETITDSTGANEPAQPSTLHPNLGLRRSSNASSLATTQSSVFTDTSTLSGVSSVTSFGSSIDPFHSKPKGVSAVLARNEAKIVTNIPNEPTESSPKSVLDIVVVDNVDLRFRRSSADDNMFVTRQACRYNCYCDCHNEENLKRRRGLSKLKKNRIRCNEVTCLNNPVNETNSTVDTERLGKLLSKLMSRSNVRDRFELKTFRMVPEGSDAMRFVKHGNLNRLKEVIDAGDTTLWDTAPDGWSLLHTAAYNRQLDIVKYLMERGIDTDVADVGQRKPFDLAFLKSIGQGATNEEEEILNIFSNKDDYLSDFEFTPIHLVVLGLYDASDSERPSLEELLDLLDDANNAPPNTKWAQWKLKYKSRSSLFGAIIEYFRSSAYEQPDGTKIIHRLIDTKDKKFHWTPLHWAASAGRVDEIDTLVKYGADPAILSNLDANIIHAGAESKLDRGLAAVLEIWPHCRDRLNINQINRWYATPLHVAAWSSAACVRLLVEAGAEPSVQQEDGQVPLHCAGLSGQDPDRVERVAILCSVNSKKHINIQDFDGRSPIFDFLDDPDCVKLLVQCGAKLDLVDNEGKTVFHHASIQDENETLRTLIHLTNDKSLATAQSFEHNTPLMEALSLSNIGSAMVLLELEDIGALISKDGWAPIHYAAKIGDLALLKAVLEHPTFIKGSKTPDGKRADAIAMEAGTWSGTVKELIRKHDYLR